MIHYQLLCAGSHAFEGWFRDSAGFEAQLQAGLVTCPECGATEIRRALMAPSIGKRRAASQPQVVDQEGRPEPTKEPVPTVGASRMPDQVRAVLQKLRAEVERSCEHVGDRFAEEARAIHDGKAAARGIYGQSTPEEARALAEDGIEVARLPWVPRSDG